MGSKIQDPRFPGKTLEQSWILDLGSEPRLKFQSVQSVSIGIQDSANRPLGRFPPLPKDLPNSMSVIALILVDLWGGGVPYTYIYIYIYVHIYIYIYLHIYIYIRTHTYVCVYVHVYVCVYLFTADVHAWVGGL